ncbi:MAG: sulfatase [Planctomycetes bacterium]|nr:sulfatase [Planctomycetota bacterium]
MRGCTKIVLSSLLAFASLLANNYADEVKPNVLFIAIDDLKPILGCYGNDIVKSPHIDSIAEKGTVFLNNHCQWPVCAPSRTSLLTGLMPEETGVEGFKAMRGILRDVVTLPEHFKNNGYVTAATGKINDPRSVGTLNKKDPTSRTKDGRTKDDIRSWSLPYVPVSSGWKASGKRASAAPDVADAKFKDGMVCKEGISLIKKLAKNDKPFFVGVGFYKPHVPWFSPKKYWDLYDREKFKVEEFQELPRGGSSSLFLNISEVHNRVDTLKSRKDPKSNNKIYPILPKDKQLELIHSYYACISFVDAQIGKLLGALEESGESENTIVILWGDHGYHLGDHGKWAKHSVMEQATRSPLIIYSPHIQHKGNSSSSPTAFLDIYPTLCELAGLSLPSQPLNQKEKSGRNIKGVSLVPIIKGAKERVRGGVLTTRRDCYAIRTDRYRYIETINEGVIVHKDLYDYKNDPQERVNLINEIEYKEVAKKLALEMRNLPESSGCQRLLRAKENLD